MKDLTQPPSSSINGGSPVQFTTVLSKLMTLTMFRAILTDSILIIHYEQHTWHMWCIKAQIHAYVFKHSLFSGLTEDLTKSLHLTSGAICTGYDQGQTSYKEDT